MRKEFPSFDRGHEESRKRKERIYHLIQNYKDALFGQQDRISMGNIYEEQTLDKVSIDESYAQDFLSLMCAGYPGRSCSDPTIAKLEDDIKKYWNSFSSKNPLRLSLEDSYGLARRHQPKSFIPNNTNESVSGPENPLFSFFLVELRRELEIGYADSLDVLESPYQFHAYTAVGTPVDFFYGVDAFIDVVDPKDGTIIQTLTIDVSTRVKAEREYNSDLFVFSGDLGAPVANSDQYHDMIDTYVSELVPKIRS